MPTGNGGMGPPIDPDLNPGNAVCHLAAVRQQERPLLLGLDARRSKRTDRFQG